jgi:D-alanyl-D-alanine carboxypeptidase
MVSVLLPGCEKQKEPQAQGCGDDYSSHVKNTKYQAVLDNYVEKGLTGIAVTVHTPEGLWTGTSGFANMEDAINLTPCDPQYAASIQKSLTSVVILQLIDEGELKFETKIGRFISDEIKGYIHNFELITVEHLLLHTSGLHDVIEEKFVNDFLSNPMASYTSEELLAYVKEPGPIDLPGKKHYYSDANYILLSIIIDSIAGSHTKAIEERILNPLKMVSSSYHNKNYPHPAGLVNSYWESPIDGSFENVSEIQNQIAQQILGSDGLLTTSTDLDIFISSLFRGNLVSNKMKELIKTIKVKNENEQWLNNYYGYGLMFLPDEDHGDWIGHSGMHIGAAGFTYYNPKYNVSISAMTNMGTFFSEKYMIMFYYELFFDLVELAFEK